MLYQQHARHRTLPVAQARLHVVHITGLNGSALTDLHRLSIPKRLVINNLLTERRLYVIDNAVLMPVSARSARARRRRLDAGTVPLFTKACFGYTTASFR
jgi:hypothetical protein